MKPKLNRCICSNYSDNKNKKKIIIKIFSENENFQLIKYIYIYV